MLTLFKAVHASGHFIQLSNVKDFATKTDLADLESKVERHESRISRIEGKP